MKESPKPPADHPSNKDLRSVFGGLGGFFHNLGAKTAAGERSTSNSSCRRVAAFALPATSPDLVRVHQRCVATERPVAEFLSQTTGPDIGRPSIERQHQSRQPRGSESRLSTAQRRCLRPMTARGSVNDESKTDDGRSLGSRFRP